MSDKTKPAETKPADVWEQTKAWADKNRTISGALLGGAAGTIVPGIGTVIGTIVGGGIGFASSKEKNVPARGTCTSASASRCCALAASGHATAAPPSSEMNSRRRITRSPRRRVRV